MSNLSFHSSNGAVFALDGEFGIHLVGLVEGLATTSVELAVDQRVGVDGAVLLNQRRGPQHLTVEVMLLDDAFTAAQRLSYWSTFQAAAYAGGMFVYDGPNGVRQLRDVVFESSTRAITDALDDRFPCTFLALDPWWYGPLESVELTFAAPTAWNAAIAWNALTPWNGGASTSVLVAGHAPVFPRFAAYFGMSSLVVSNGTDSWTLDTVLPASGSTSVVSVDHRPGRRGPRYGSELIAGYPEGGLNWGLLSEDSRVDWSMPVGLSSLIFGATGTTASSGLTMFWEPRWLTP